MGILWDGLLLACKGYLNHANSLLIQFSAILAIDICLSRSCAILLLLFSALLSRLSFLAVIFMAGIADAAIWSVPDFIPALVEAVTVAGIEVGVADGCLYIASILIVSVVVAVFTI